MGIEHIIAVANELICSTNEKQRGFLVTLDEHHFIQCSSYPALTGWKRLVEFLHDIQ